MTSFRTMPPTVFMRNNKSAQGNILHGNQRTPDFRQTFGLDHQFSQLLPFPDRSVNRPVIDHFGLNVRVAQNREQQGQVLLRHQPDTVLRTHPDFGFGYRFFPRWQLSSRQNFETTS